MKWWSGTDGCQCVEEDGPQSDRNGATAGFPKRNRGLRNTEAVGELPLRQAGALPHLSERRCLFWLWTTEGNGRHERDEVTSPASIGESFLYDLSEGQHSPWQAVVTP